MEVFSASCPAAIVDGSIIRVDIFQNSLGNLVVNEFESLEAAYYSRSGVNEAKVATTMTVFFSNELAKFLEI